MLKDRVTLENLNEALVLPLSALLSLSVSQTLSSHTLVKVSTFFSTTVALSVSEKTGSKENLCSLYLCVLCAL